MVNTELALILGTGPGLGYAVAHRCARDGMAVAIAGAVLVAAAGGLALGSQPPPGLSARYDLDVDDADDEWRLASVEDAEGFEGGDGDAGGRR